VTLKDGRFAGAPFDWLTPYSLLVAAGLVGRIRLLGACWLIWRPRTSCTGRARRWAWITALAVAVLLACGKRGQPLSFTHRSRLALGYEAGHFDSSLFPAVADPLLGAIGLTILVTGLKRRAQQLALRSALPDVPVGLSRARRRLLFRTSFPTA